MVDLTSMFASVPATTERLIEMGFALGIVSTKFRYRIEDILAREGLSDRFGIIIGGEGRCRPKTTSPWFNNCYR